MCMYACTQPAELMKAVVSYACPRHFFDIIFNAFPEPLEYFQQYSGQLSSLESGIVMLIRFHMKIFVVNF